MDLLPTPAEVARAKNDLIAQRIAAGIDIVSGRPLLCDIRCKYPHLCCHDHCVDRAIAQAPRLALASSSPR